MELIGLWPPVGPDDPLVVRLSDPTLPADPEIRDPDGNLVAVAPVTYDGAAVAPFGWRPDDGWVPGAYALRRVGPLSDVDETFTVGPYGVEGIDPASLVGRAWRATGAVSTSGLEGLALATGTPIVAIEDADADGTVGFVVAVELADGASCMVLRDRASFDGSRSRLSWAWDEASIAPSGGDPVEAWDLWAQLDYLADGTGAAGRAHAEVDLQSLDPDCGLISTFGVACRPCPGRRPDLPS